jgi:hypothetical protein
MRTEDLHEGLNARWASDIAARSGKDFPLNARTPVHQNLRLLAVTTGQAAVDAVHGWTDGRSTHGG